MTDKLKVKAKNEPGDAEGIGESNMENGDMPTGDATDSVLGDKWKLNRNCWHPYDGYICVHASRVIPRGIFITRKKHPNPREKDFRVLLI